MSYKPNDEIVDDLLDKFEGEYTITYTLADGAEIYRRSTPFADVAVDLVGDAEEAFKSHMNLLHEAAMEGRYDV